MEHAVKVQVFENGKLIREIEEDSVAVVLRKSTFIDFSGIDVMGVVAIASNASRLYDKLINVLKSEFHIDDSRISELIKLYRLHTMEVEGGGNG